MTRVLFTKPSVEQRLLRMRFRYIHIIICHHRSIIMAAEQDESTVKCGTPIQQDSQITPDGRGLPPYYMNY